MEQAHTFTAQRHHGYTGNQQPNINNPFVVIDQQPSPRPAFPYSLPLKWILGFSISKCIFGSLLFITGIFEVVLLRYELKIAFAIWCGLTILGNGIAGCVLKCKQSKCLIGTFLALSIVSLIFDVSMLSFYSALLEYFIIVGYDYCYYRWYLNGYYCYRRMPRSDQDLGIGLTGFLIFMVCCELCFSIGSVVVSCKAYSKCCNTCDANDCCTCLGCCECDSGPLHTEQGRSQNGMRFATNQTMQMRSMQPSGFQYNPNQPQVNTIVQNPPGFSAQGAQSNPCSGIVSFVINIPSYIFGGANGAQLSALNVNLQPVASYQQVSDSEPARRGEEVQGANIGGVQQIQGESLLEQLNV